MLIKLIDNERLGTHINNMHWAVIDVRNARHALLTSDRPVEISRLKEPQGILSIPISPTHLFVAANTNGTLQSISKADPNRVVATVNKYVTSRARRFVYAPDESQTQFVRKYMSKGMEPLPLFPHTAKIGTPGYVPRE